MEIKKELPIKKIGEENWVEKLTEFLEYYDVSNIDGDIISDNLKDSLSMSDEIARYYESFGKIDSSDFMYNLKPIDEFVALKDSDWSFVKEKFGKEEISDFIVFSQSPGNDPVCYKKGDTKIYLFSHDPVNKAIIFNSFNDYLLFELVQLEKLMGDAGFDDKSEENNFYKEVLNDDGVDIDFRYMKM